MQVIPPLQVIEAHKGGVWSICVAPSGLIVTAGGDGLIKSWRLEASSGELLPLAQAVTPHTEVLLVRQSSPGVLLSVGHEGGLAAWELNPDSGQLAQRQQPVLPDDRQHYNDRLLETASGHLVAWAYGTVGYPAVCRWSELARTFVFLQDLPIERASVFLELPDGDLLSGDEMGRICRWRLEKSSGVWNKAGAIQAHEGPIHALAWTREHTLISAGGNEPLLKVWRADGGEGWVLEKPLRGHQSSILEVLEADSAELLSADRGQRSLLGWRHEPEVLIWSKGPEGFRLTQRQPGRLRGCVAGDLILENDEASTLSLWRSKQERYEHIAVLDRKRRGGVSTLASLTSGSLVAGGTDGRLICWTFVSSCNRGAKERHHARPQ
jgi:WD40 repeat protein